jgi:phosphatidylserine synthase
LVTFFTALFILIGGIIKLSRFNSEGLVAAEGNKYYRGLTVPFVLMITAICYIIFDKISGNIIYYVPFIMLATAALMVSNIKIKKSNNYLWYLLMVLILWMLY